MGSGGKGAQISNVNHNFKALISKKINIPSSDTDHLTKEDTCKSEGKSGHNLIINAKNCNGMDTRNALVLVTSSQERTLSHTILRLLMYVVYSIIST